MHRRLARMRPVSSGENLGVRARIGDFGSAALTGVATIIHRGKFSHSHLAFWLSAGLYVTTPFLTFWAG